MQPAWFWSRSRTRVGEQLSSFRKAYTAGVVCARERAVWERRHDDSWEEAMHLSFPPPSSTHTYQVFMGTGGKVSGHECFVTSSEKARISLCFCKNVYEESVFFRRI